MGPAARSSESAERIRFRSAAGPLALRDQADRDVRSPSEAARGKRSGDRSVRVRSAVHHDHQRQFRSAEAQRFAAACDRYTRQGTRAVRMRGTRRGQAPETLDGPATWDSQRMSSASARSRHRGASGRTSSSGASGRQGDVDENGRDRDRHDRGKSRRPRPGMSRQCQRFSGSG